MSHRRRARSTPWTTERTRSGAVLGASEALTVEQALHAYTVGSAYAAFEELDKGRLIPGMYADFAVLSDDPFRVGPQNLAQLHVTSTVVGGKVVYTR